MSKNEVFLYTTLEWFSECTAKSKKKIQGEEKFVQGSIIQLRTEG